MVYLDVSADEIIEELGEHQMKQLVETWLNEHDTKTPTPPGLDEVYEELRRGQIGERTRNYIHAHLGRILP